MDANSSPRARRRARTLFAGAVLAAVVLVAGACRPEPPTATRLIGTWYIRSVSDGTALQPVTSGVGALHLVFSANGDLHLSYGCDGWATRWSFQDGSLDIPTAFVHQPRENDRGCWTDADRIDDDVAALVPSATWFERRGDALSLLTKEGGRVLVTARSTPIPLPTTTTISVPDPHGVDDTSGGPCDPAVPACAHNHP